MPPGFAFRATIVVSFAFKRPGAKILDLENLMTEAEEKHEVPAVFSVILPVFNRSHVLERAVESVRRQTYGHWELIIVDDGSRDQSYNIASGFADTRIKAYRLQHNSGAAAARNHGIRRSSGKYISFLDSDDYFEPDFLQESSALLSKSSDDIGFIWTGSRVLRGTSVTEQQWEPVRKETPYFTLLHSLRMGTGAGVTVRRCVFEKCGLFNDALPAAEDTEFFLRVARQYDFSSVERILINIQSEGDDRLSKNFAKIAQAYNLFIKDHAAAINMDKALQQKYWYKLMWLNYHLGDKAKARRYWRELAQSRALTAKSLVLSLLFEIGGVKLGRRLHVGSAWYRQY